MASRPRVSSSNPILGFLTFVGEITLILIDALRRFFRRPFEFGEVVQQMAFIGAASVPIVLLTTFFSGSVLALYSSEILVRYGGGSLAGGTIALAVGREIAPVLAGIMVAARCGSAMSAQIGSMAVTEQLDAMRSLSVHPTQYLVIPRLIASMTMVPVLCLLGAYAGIAGGYLVSASNGIPGGSFVQSVRQFAEPWDFGGGLVKCVVFGFIVAIVACQQGLRTRDGAVGVGRSTTPAVVVSMVLIYVANYFLADLLY